MDGEIPPFPTSFEKWMADHASLNAPSSELEFTFWSSNEVEEWLSRVGLSQYAASFRNQSITGAVLPQLTDQDLEKYFGISTLGHRKRILSEIAKLRSQTKYQVCSFYLTILEIKKPFLLRN